MASHLPNLSNYQSCPSWCKIPSKGRHVVGSSIRIFLILQTSLLTAAQTVDLRTWQARLAEDNDKKITVTSAAGQVNLLDMHGLVVAIPAGSIYEIFHTTRRVRRSAKVHNAFEQECCPKGNTHHATHLLSAVVG